MPARKYKTDPAQLLAEGQQIVHTTSNAKYRHKVEMVNLVLSGLTPSYLSTYCGHSKRTITLWVKIADEQGFEALKPKKPTGKPPKLTKEQMAEIRTVIEEDDPKRYGHNVWDGPSLSACIEKTFAVKEKTTKRNVWNIKKLKELHNDDSAGIIYQDEAH